MLPKSATRPTYSSPSVSSRTGVSRSASTDQFTPMFPGFPDVGSSSLNSQTSLSDQYKHEFIDNLQHSSRHQQGDSSAMGVPTGYPYLQQHLNIFTPSSSVASLNQHADFGADLADQMDSEELDDSDSESLIRDVDKRNGRRKIKIEFIEDRSKRNTTFSKRKSGIMKKAYELSTLTGTQILLLVASETGHVYTYATPKLQPIIMKSEGKNMIQDCLNSPDFEDDAHSDYEQEELLSQRELMRHSPSTSDFIQTYNQDPLIYNEESFQRIHHPINSRTSMPILTSPPTIINSPSPHPSMHMMSHHPSFLQHTYHSHPASYLSQPLSNNSWISSPPPSMSQQTNLASVHNNTNSSAPIDPSGGPIPQSIIYHSQPSPYVAPSGRSS